MKQNGIGAVAMTIVLGVSVLAGVGLGTSSQQATGIAECTTINESGTYELTQDITYADENQGCIIVKADDVTIDGNGHELRYNQSKDDHAVLGPGIAINDASNVAIHNVTFGVDSGLRASNATALTVQDNRFVAAADIYESTDLTFKSNVFENHGPVFQYSGDVHLIENRFQDGKLGSLGGTGAFIVRGNVGSATLDLGVTNGSVTVHNNSFGAIWVDAAADVPVTITRNDVTGGDLSVNADSTTQVENNTITGGGVTLAGNSEEFVFSHNTVTGADVGVEIMGGYERGPPVSLTHNVITNNTIGIETHSDRPEIHHNDLSANTEYGVLYTEDNGVVNATHNYWGDQPSSTEDEHAPFEDPETGALANGTGSAVSEGAAPAGAEPGVSNVHFDPWLDTAPDAGVVDQSADDDSTDDTTTTTTNEPTTTTTTDDAETTTTTTTTDDTTTTTTTDEPTTTTNDGDDDDARDC